MKKLRRFSLLIVAIFFMVVFYLNVIQHREISRTHQTQTSPKLAPQQRDGSPSSSPSLAAIQTLQVNEATSKISKQHEIRRHFDVSVVAVVGNDFSGEADLPATAKFILVLPHRLNSNVRSLNELKQQDMETVEQLVYFLEDFHTFEAATGLSDSIDSLNKSVCRYQIQHNTLVLRNTGKHVKGNFLSTHITFQECNIVDTAFLIKKSDFLKYDFRNKYGLTSVIDFFVRSGRGLKIAKLGSLFLSAAVNYKDRGILNGKIRYFDYMQFGRDHNILRIISPDKITWTQCSMSETLCYERPLIKRSSSEMALPICCNEVLDEILRDFATSLEQIDTKYLVSYGTLLGAVRNKAIIPWTRDVDLALSREDIKTKVVFRELQSRLHDKYYIGYFELQDRAIPHFMPSINVDTSQFFTGPDDLRGKDHILFGDKVLKEMNKMLPVTVSWLRYVYLDFYDEAKSELLDTSSITINGRKYPTYKDPVAFLKILYGSNYTTPVKD